MYILRVATVHDTDVASLPEEFRSVLTKQDVAAITTGPGYFAKLADKSSPKWLRTILNECAGSGYTLQFVASGDSKYCPYYRFHWQGEPGISLPRSKRLRADMPAFLRAIYRVIGSFNENGFEFAGGLDAAEDLRPASEGGMWIEPGGSIDASKAIPFLGTLSGNQLCYLPGGKGAWLESCKFRTVRSLEREVARYFEALIKGTRI